MSEQSNKSNNEVTEITELSVISENSIVSDQELIARKLKYQQRLDQINNNTAVNKTQELRQIVQDNNNKERSFIFKKHRKSLDLSNSQLGMQILNQVSNNQSMQISKLSESILTISNINASIIDNTQELSQTSSNKNDVLQNKLNEKIYKMKKTKEQESTQKKKLIKINLDELNMDLEEKKLDEKDKESNIKDIKKPLIKKYTQKLKFEENNSSFLFNRKDYSKFTSLSPKFQNKNSVNLKPTNSIQQLHKQTVKDLEDYKNLQKKMDSLLLSEQKQFKQNLKKEMNQQNKIEVEEIKKDIQFKKNLQNIQSKQQKQQINQNKLKYQNLKATNNELSNDRYQIYQSQTTYQVNQKREAQWQLSLIQQEKQKLLRKINMLTNTAKSTKR